MINARRTALFVIFLSALAACNFPGRDGVPEPTWPPAGPENTATIPVRSPTETSAPATGAIPIPPDRSPEVIMILAPGPGSRLTSPFDVRGVADPTFEQTLVARLVDPGGSVLTEKPLIIQSPLGERGPFETSIEFAVSSETNALLQIYATSARDGGITHLESVGVMLVPGGPQELVERDPYPEQIAIRKPENNQQISGGVLHVEGIGVASFEGTLVLELYDADGALLDSQPIIVDAPEMGQPGTFQGEVSYSITQPGPARLLVRDPLPVFDGVNHIASVEIQLLP